MLLKSLLDTKFRHRVLKDKYIIDYISVQGKDCISEAFGGSLVTPAFFVKFSILFQALHNVWTMVQGLDNPRKVAKVNVALGTRRLRSDQAETKVS